MQDGKIKFFNPEKLNDPRYGEFEFTPLEWLILLRQSVEDSFFFVII